jgi:hypothetical protein
LVLGPDGRRQKPLTEAAWAVINEKLTAVIAARLCQERCPDKYGPTAIHYDFFVGGFFSLMTLSRSRRLSTPLATLAIATTISASSNGLGSNGSPG